MSIVGFLTVRSCPAEYRVPQKSRESCRSRHPYVAELNDSDHFILHISSSKEAGPCITPTFLFRGSGVSSASWPEGPCCGSRWPRRPNHPHPTTPTPPFSTRPCPTRPRDGLRSSKGRPSLRTRWRAGPSGPPWWNGSMSGSCCKCSRIYRRRPPTGSTTTCR